MDFEKKTTEELIDESLKIKAQIQELREKRKEIKAVIARRNAQASVAAKLGRLSDTEKQMLKEAVNGSGDVVVTPKPARLNVKGN